MSGIDEVKRFAPECPKCEHCNEWFMGGQQWMLTRESMEKRRLHHALICFRRNGPDEYALTLTYRCITCSHTVTHDSDVGQMLYEAFMSQQGGFYNSLIDGGGRNRDEERIWKK